MSSPQLKLSAQHLRHGPWSPLEDKRLQEFVDANGPDDWMRAPEHVGLRSPLQCMIRYYRHLKHAPKEKLPEESFSSQGPSKPNL